MPQRPTVISTVDQERASKTPTKNSAELPLGVCDRPKFLFPFIVGIVQTNLELVLIAVQVLFRDVMQSSDKAYVVRKFRYPFIAQLLGPHRAESIS
jgi:hypothetical protein